MPDGFEVRGVVEGFYGPPWTHQARRDVLDFVAARGMNAYVYAPKDDPFHRARWREPYPAAELDALVDLHRHCRSLDVRFGFALSPGLDVDAGAQTDREAVMAKLLAFATEGVDWFVLAFDDVPMRDGAGAAHADLCGWLRERVEGRLSVVPTDYVGTARSAYLDDLAAGLPADVDLLWTGTTVVPPTITAAEAEARRAATGEHPLIVWDNYPVNDAFMADSLHLGPVVGRDPRLVSVCAGLLANPMPQARASMVALATAADFLSDPAAYDPERSWERAIAAIGGEATPALRALGRACAASRLEPRVPLHDLVDGLEAGAPGAAKVLADDLEAAASLPAGLPEELATEIGPWAEQTAAEASVGLAALRALAGEGAGGEPWAAVWSRMGLLFQWSAARRASNRVAFGARFACYPGIVLDESGNVAVDGDLSLVEDANAIDRLCRLALGSRV